MKFPVSILACMVLLWSGWVVASRGDTITGRASVVDGDTLEIRTVRIRLHGIDAPESAQRCRNARGEPYLCGARSALLLSEQTGVRNVTCTERDRDRYGRIVAVCRLGARDLNAWMVQQGLAVAYRQYSRDYIRLEDEARAARRGLWAGAFQMPAEYRRSPGAIPSAKSRPGAMTTAPAAKRRFATCAEARAAGAAPLRRRTPEYNPKLDRDRDGVACD
jgi:endonuclease YncB( thermonuclease family)